MLEIRRITFLRPSCWRLLVANFLTSFWLETVTLDARRGDTNLQINSNVANQVSLSLCEQYRTTVIIVYMPFLFQSKDWRLAQINMWLSSLHMMAIRLQENDNVSTVHSYIIYTCTSTLEQNNITECSVCILISQSASRCRYVWTTDIVLVMKRYQKRTVDDNDDGKIDIIIVHYQAHYRPGQPIELISHRTKIYRPRLS